MNCESILLTTTQVSTFSGTALLSRATGFFFSRDNRLYCITNRHIVIDEAAGHQPDQIQIMLHTNRDNVTQTIEFAIPLYDANGGRRWREASDTSGLVDVVALQLKPEEFPEGAIYYAFDHNHLPKDMARIEVGESIRIIGFPLSFKDTLHGLPVMRHAIIASSFSLRFQGQGYFLTDSLLHRGSSGSPVVMRTSKAQSGRTGFPWRLLGIHSSRLDVSNRDVMEDERLNLFTAWYSDVLTVLTEDGANETAEMERVAVDCD
ncbi:MAG: trypsin-like peptidase domain-containing protein [Gammaproteobacteria bacterium]|nr:trypsin-like peptidase domain-containing protein [Gammaproteobacteria bacterium]